MKLTVSPNGKNNCKYLPCIILSYINAMHLIAVSVYINYGIVVNGSLYIKFKKLTAQLLMKLHLRATGCHLPYEITSLQVNTLRVNPCHRPVHDLPTTNGQKAELT